MDLRDQASAPASSTLEGVAEVNTGHIAFARDDFSESQPADLQGGRLPDTRR
jgi:hypothetical protein